MMEEDDVENDGLEEKEKEEEVDDFQEREDRSQDRTAHFLRA